MTIRTSSKTVVFTRPFSLNGIDEVLPAGSYVVQTDEELIEGLSFLSYRRVSTAIILPAVSRRSSSTQVVTIDPLDLAAAQDMDASAKYSDLHHRTPYLLRQPSISKEVHASREPARGCLRRRTSGLLKRHRTREGQLTSSH